MSTILFSSTRKVQGRTRKARTFAEGVFPQRPARVPIGPTPQETRWWAFVSNQGTTQYTTDEQDDRDRSAGMSAAEFEEARIEASIARFDRYHANELAEWGISTECE